MFVRTMPTPPLFNTTDPAASHADPVSVQAAIRTALNDPDLWSSIERYLIPPGVCGSRAFDQANVIRNLLEWDAEHGGKIAEFGLSDIILWEHVYRELGKTYDTRKGQILGLRVDRSPPGSLHN